MARRVRQAWFKGGAPPGVVAHSNAGGGGAGPGEGTVVVSRRGGTLTVSHTPLPGNAAPEAICSFRGAEGAEVVCGCAGGHTLVALIPPGDRPTVEVWSGLTGRVVAELACPGRPSSLRFDTELMTAVVGGVLLAAALHGSGGWHPVCAAGNIATTFVAWPHILALERHGHTVWYANAEAGVSAASVVATRHDVEEGGARLGRAAGRGAYASVLEHALAPRARTVRCVGELVGSGAGSVEWTSLDTESRGVVVSAVRLDDLHPRSRPTPVRRTRVPWPMAHRDLFPAADAHTVHCSVPHPGGGGATTRHVLVPARRPGESGGPVQLLQTAVGEWHRTHVVGANAPPVRGLAPADAPGTVGVWFGGGGYALLQTI